MYTLTAEFNILSLYPVLILLGVCSIVPIIFSIFKIKVIPVVAIEILEGIILSYIFKDSDIFNSDVTEGVYNIGLILLLFLSGFETDYKVLKKTIKGDGININPFKYACIILGSVILLGFGCSFIFSKYITGDFIKGILLITIVVSSTFASIVVPIVHQSGHGETTVGQIFSTFAILSELLSICALSVFMLVNSITEGGNPIWLLVIFVLLVVTTILVKKIPSKTLDNYRNKFVNVGLRLVIFLILFLSILSSVAGVEIIFGAFVAGMLLKFVGMKEETEHQVSVVAYGIFIPMFFILAGYKANVFELFASNENILENILLILLILVVLLITKLPFLILKKYYKSGTSLPLALLSTCTIIVPLALEHMNHVLHLFNHEFVSCMIVACTISTIISSIAFRLNKKFNISKEKYADIILEYDEVEHVEE